MEWWGIAALGGLGSLIASAWHQVKTFANLLAGVLVRRVEVDGTVGSAVVAYLHTHYKRYGGHRRVDGVFLRRTADGRQVMAASELLGAFPGVYRRGWRVMTHSGVGSGETTPPRAHAVNEPPQQVFGSTKSTLVSPRLVGVDLDALVATAVRAFSTRTPGSYTLELRFEEQSDAKLLTSGGSFQSWENGTQLPVSHAKEEFETAVSRAEDSLVLWDELSRLVDEARAWFRNRPWYATRGLPWRRGWMLFGPPGSGKTRLAMATAADLKLPLVVIRLAGVTETWFRKAWETASSHAPCMVLLEDLDGVFVGRKNVSASPPLDYFGDQDSAPGIGRRVAHPNYLTFDALLGAVDGPTTADGVFLVVTTNHPEKIDPAMGGWAAPDGSPGERPADGESSRPGRIDRVVEIGAMPAEAQRRLAERLLADDAAAYQDSLKKIASGETAEWPAVKWREWCVRLALARMTEKLSSS